MRATLLATMALLAASACSGSGDPNRSPTSSTPTTAPATTDSDVLATFDVAFDLASETLHITYRDRAGSTLGTRDVFPSGTSSNQVQINTDLSSLTWNAATLKLSANVTLTNNLAIPLANTTTTFVSTTPTGITTGGPYAYGTVANGATSGSVAWTFTLPSATNFTATGYITGTVSTNYVAAWNLLEQTGASAADATGGGHTGSACSAAYPLSWAAPGLTFAGVAPGTSSSCMTASGFTDLGSSTTSFTLTTWVKPSLASPRGVLFHLSSVVDGSPGWCTPYLGFDSSGDLVAQALLTGTQNYVLAASTGNVTPQSTWTHVAMTGTISGTAPSQTLTTALYVNGALKKSASGTGTVFTNGTSMYAFWGSEANGASCWHGPATGSNIITSGGFNGAMDRMAIYNRALTTTEIAALAAGTP